jgi:soluble lytic murein transglycosylase-like protein
MVASILSNACHVFANDRELRESSRCSSIFRFFERKYHLPHEILHSIALQESRKSHSQYKISVVWPWTVGVQGQGFYFATRQEAVRFTREQLRSGQTNIDVGCMQINLKHHPGAFKNLDQAFLPQYNVNYAASLLRQHYDKHKDWDAAIGHYHSSTAHLAHIYQARVKKISRDMPEYKSELAKYIYSARYALHSDKRADYAKLESVRKRQRKAVQYDELFLQRVN